MRLLREYEKPVHEGRKEPVATRPEREQLANNASSAM